MIRITGIVEVEKIPYSGCQLIWQEVVRIKMHLYGGAYTSSDLNEPMQLGTCGPGAHYDPWDHNFK